MGTVTIYEGATEAWDNGPGSYAEDPNLPEPRTVIDTTDYRGVGLAVLEVTYKGVDLRTSVQTKYLANRYDPYLNTNSLLEGSGVYITDIVYSENGALSERYENFLMKPESMLFYGDTDLLGEYIFQYDDTIIGSSKGERIYGYAGNDYINSGPGDDELNGGYGTDRLIGGPGNDTAIYNFEQRNYVVSRLPNSNEVRIMFAGGGEEILSEIENIRFADLTVNTSESRFLGWYTDLDQGTKNPVYRFYNTRDNAFFYTADSAESATVLTNSLPSSSSGDTSWPYVFQGSTFSAASTSTSNTTTIHRFFNVDTGHHLWSIDPNEIAFIKSKWESGEWSYRYEGTSYRVYSSDPNPTDPNIGEKIYRLYNSAEGRHFYTADVEEVNQFQLTGVWQLEGVAFWGE